MLSVLNCSLLFQVILAIFVPYFYPEAKIGVDFRVFFCPSRCKRGTQWESDEMSPTVQCGTQWDTVGHHGTEYAEQKYHSDDY